MNQQIKVYLTFDFETDEDDENAFDDKQLEIEYFVNALEVKLNSVGVEVSDMEWK